MFRIKYTYYDAGYYHRQFWSMLDEKTAPAIAKVPPLAAGVRARDGGAALNDERAEIESDVNAIVGINTTFYTILARFEATTIATQREHLS